MLQDTNFDKGFDENATTHDCDVSINQMQVVGESWYGLSENRKNYSKRINLNQLM